MFDGLDWSKSEGVIGSLGKIYDNTKNTIKTIDNAEANLINSGSRIIKGVKQLVKDLENLKFKEQELNDNIRSDVEEEFKKTGKNINRLNVRMQMEIESIKRINAEKENLVKEYEETLRVNRVGLGDCYVEFLNALRLGSFNRAMASEMPYEVKEVYFREMSDEEKSEYGFPNSYYEDNDNAAQKRKYFVGDSSSALDELNKISTSRSSSFSSTLNKAKNSQATPGKKGYNPAFTAAAITAMLNTMDTISEKQKEQLYDERNKANDERKTYAEKYKDFNKDITSYKKNMEEMNSTINTLPIEIERLKQEIKDGEEQIKEYEKELAILEKNIAEQNKGGVR